MKLTSRANLILLAGSGALIGLLLGIGLMDASVLPVLIIPWALLAVLFVGLVVVAGREKGEPKERAAPVRAQPQAAPSALAIGFAFPDVPPGYPNVVGVDDVIHVKVSVRARGAPAEGAALRLSGKLRDGARFVAGEGVTGSDGSVTINVRPPSPGELILEAEAVLQDLRGTATASVSLVRYDEEIERLFGEFRSYAHSALGPESMADTARELAEKLREGSDPQSAKALLELARVYELVVYGDRKADRRLYLALVGALLTLQKEE